MKDRLQKFLDAEQINPSKLADILGIQRSGMSHILSGRNKPGFEFIQKLILKFPHLNAEWLITGKGEIYKDNRATYIESNLYSNTIFDIQKSSDVSNNEINPTVSAPDQPRENRLNENIRTLIDNKKSLIKVIMIYSDSTFAEYNKE